MYHIPDALAVLSACRSSHLLVRSSKLQLWQPAYSRHIKEHCTFVLATLTANKMPSPRVFSCSSNSWWFIAIGSARAAPASRKQMTRRSWQINGGMTNCLWSLAQLVELFRVIAVSLRLIGVRYPRERRVCELLQEFRLKAPERLIECELSGFGDAKTRHAYWWLFRASEEGLTEIAAIYFWRGSLTPEFDYCCQWTALVMTTTRTKNKTSLRIKDCRSICLQWTWPFLFIEHESRSVYISGPDFVRAKPVSRDGLYLHMEINVYVLVNCPVTVLQQTH